ncbi:MAG: hypothetical protein QM498_09315 [Desulfobacterium sp.]
MKPDKIMDGISKEIMTSLKQMGKTTTTDERLKHSKIIKNLCDSLDVFFGFMNEISSYDYDDEEEDGDTPFDLMDTGPIQ